MSLCFLLGYASATESQLSLQGFEARGSNISAKRFAFRHVIHETKYGNFTQKPVELMSMLQAVRHKRDVVIVASPPSPNLPQTSPMPQTAPGVPPTTSSVPPSYPVVPTTSSIPPESQNNKSPHPPPTTAAPVPTKHHSTTSSIPSSSHDNNSLYSPRESYTLPDIQSSSGDGYEPAICTDIWTRSIYGKIAVHYNDVIMSSMASKITSLKIVYSTGYSRADQRKHQSSASLAFVWGIHRSPVNSPHKGPVTRNFFPFDDVIMCFT